MAKEPGQGGGKLSTISSCSPGEAIFESETDVFSGMTADIVLSVGAEIQVSTLAGGIFQGYSNSGPWSGDRIDDDSLQESFGIIS